MIEDATTLRYVNDRFATFPSRFVRETRRLDVSSSYQRRMFESDSNDPQISFARFRLAFNGEDITRPQYIDLVPHPPQQLAWDDEDGLTTLLEEISASQRAIAEEDVLDFASALSGSGNSR